MDFRLTIDYWLLMIGKDLPNPDKPELGNWGIEELRIEEFKI